MPVVIGSLGGHCVSPVSEPLRSSALRLHTLELDFPTSYLSPDLPIMSGRVPAWKRLGLQLKSAAASSDGHSDGPGATSASKNAAQGSALSTPAKRKPSAALASDHSAKKTRKDTLDAPGAQTPASSGKKKSVTFLAEPQDSASPAATPSAKQAQPRQKPKQKKPPASNSVRQNSVNLQPALEYLRLWHTARSQWKFNKNHQSKLLENVFSETTIPAVDINVFYEYIRDLKGYVRTRLRQTAIEVKKGDMEQGAQGFPTASEEVAARKQAEYEETIAAFLRDGQNTPAKRRFEEVDYVLRTADMEMQRRVVKRMRAETVIEELSDSEEGATTTTSSSSASTGTSKQMDAADVDADGDKRMKLNDSSPQKVKRKRKARTTEVEDSSSSSESDSDSDSDSDLSSSSGDAGNVKTSVSRPQARQGAADTSSSSSSSSSSESEDSSSDDDSDDE